MNEWSLLIFTLALQIAVGGMLALALISCLGSGKARFAEWGFFSVVAVVGSIFSVTHLGDMFGFYRAFANISSSWLTREAWLAVIFVALALACTMQAWRGTQKAFLPALAAVAGVLFVFASARVYAGSSVEKWATTCPYADFFAAALLIGPFVVAWLRGAEDAADLRILRVLFSLGVILFVLNIGFFGAGHEPIALVRLLLTSVGLVMGFCSLFAQKGARSLAVAGVCLLVLGEGIGRYLFFQ